MLCACAAHYRKCDRRFPLLCYAAHFSTHTMRRDAAIRPGCLATETLRQPACLTFMLTFRLLAYALAQATIPAPAERYSQICTPCSPFCVLHTVSSVSATTQQCGANQPHKHTQCALFKCACHPFRHWVELLSFVTLPSASGAQRTTLSHSLCAHTYQSAAIGQLALQTQLTQLILSELVIPVAHTDTQ